MLASISTSSSAILKNILYSLCIFTVILIATPTHAADPNQPSGTDKSQEEDFSQTPYTEYGQFNEEEEETENTLFFQYGRFFGVSVGAGYHGATGNRGALWQGGFPFISLMLHYWFDFQFALQLNFNNVSHYFTQVSNRTDVNLIYLGVDLKYYFDTRNLSAAMSFANPFILIGGEGSTKTQTNLSDPADPDKDSTVGFNIGGGLEFPISLRRSYFTLQAKLYLINYQDRFTELFKSYGLSDLSGYYYSFSGHILFTW